MDGASSSAYTVGSPATGTPDGLVAANPSAGTDTAAPGAPGAPAAAAPAGAQDRDWPAAASARRSRWTRAPPTRSECTW